MTQPLDITGPTARERLVAWFEAARAELEMTETNFGRAAARHAYFLRRLRSGSISISTIEAAESWCRHELAAKRGERNRKAAGQVA